MYNGFHIFFKKIIIKSKQPSCMIQYALLQLTVEAWTTLVYRATRKVLEGAEGQKQIETRARYWKQSVPNHHHNSFFCFMLGNIIFLQTRVGSRRWLGRIKGAGSSCKILFVFLQALIPLCSVISILHYYVLILYEHVLLIYFCYIYYVCYFVICIYNSIFK